MTEYTNIRISTDARESLKDMGSKSDTYSDIIIRLVAMWHEEHNE